MRFKATVVYVCVCLEGRRTKDRREANNRDEARRKKVRRLECRFAAEALFLFPEEKKRHLFTSVCI